MLLFSYLKDNQNRLGYVFEDNWYDLGHELAVSGSSVSLRKAKNIVELIEKNLLNHTDLVAITSRPGKTALCYEKIIFQSPTGIPRNIIGVGRNYGAHANEGGLEPQKEPRLFAKLTTSITGHREKINRPVNVKKLDWEGELGVIIGKTLKAADESESLLAIAGYTSLNDITAREFQFDRIPGQTTFAKSHDTFCPIGPAMLVATDIIRHDAFKIETCVNGKRMQQGQTDDLIFPIPYLISYISRYISLQPGDVIATGTPAGVGHFREPPVYLQPGDVVRVKVSGLPYLENKVVQI